MYNSYYTTKRTIGEWSIKYTAHTALTQQEEKDGVKKVGGIGKSPLNVNKSDMINKFLIGNIGKK